MRVALIADIQGNGTALDVALGSIDALGVDRIICLGDVATGPNPTKVINALRQHDCLTVMGNMDDVILHPLPYVGTDASERKNAEIDRWCYDQLTADDKFYLEDFSKLLHVDLGDDMRLLCFHGSPRSFDDVITATTPEPTLQRLLTGFQAEFMATGHMHEQFLRRFRETVILSPGSIGLPNPAGELGKRPLLTEFAIVEYIDGRLKTEFHVEGYHPQDFKNSVLNSGMPHAQWYLDHWYVD